MSTMHANPDTTSYPVSTEGSSVTDTTTAKPDPTTSSVSTEGPTVTDTTTANPDTTTLCALNEGLIVTNDCADVYRSGHNTSGVYRIQMNDSQVPVYCEMEVSGNINIHCSGSELAKLIKWMTQN